MEPTYEQLYSFYNEIINLTLNHEYIVIDRNGGHAVVYPRQLSKELSKVNPKWAEVSFVKES
jgi:hypothetical protein